MPTSWLTSSTLNPRTWLLCAAAVAFAGGCSDSNGLNLGDAGVDAKRGTDAKARTDARVACEQAGGSCVAVYPGTCTSGTVVSLSCGSGVGTECCMPGGGGGSSGTGGRGGLGGRTGSGGASGAGGTHASGGASGTGGRPGTTCQQAGGSCVPLIPGCQSGIVVSLSCESGLGAECCMPGGKDAGIDSGKQKLTELCTATGGEVTTELCCSGAADFPDTCGTGACGCAPSASRVTSICACSAGCFSRTFGCLTK
jgi:hypothetical protein